MINKLLEAVSNILSDNFGERYKVYKEPVKGQITAPYFYIRCLDVKQSLVKRNRYRRESLIDVIYTPSSEFAPVYETNEVIEELFDLLEIIEFEGQKVEANKMKSILLDGVIHFKVRYTFDLCKWEEKTSYMDTMSWKDLK